MNTADIKISIVVLICINILGCTKNTYDPVQFDTIDTVFMRRMIPIEDTLNTDRNYIHLSPKINDFE